MYTKLMLPSPTSVTCRARPAVKAVDKGLLMLWRAIRADGPVCAAYTRQRPKAPIGVHQWAAKIIYTLHCPILRCCV